MQRAQVWAGRELAPTRHTEFTATTEAPARRGEDQTPQVPQRRPGTNKAFFFLKEGLRYGINCSVKMALLLLSHFSRVRLCGIQWTAAHQAPPPLGFSRQEHWSGLPFPSPMHESEVAQSCPTLCDPMDCSLPGSSVHGIFQARVLEWGAIAFSKNGIRDQHFGNDCWLGQHILVSAGF